MLFYLVHSRDVRNALIFTKSAESTTRLLQLFEFFEQARVKISSKDGVQPLSIRAYSSDLSVGERKSILDSFKAQDIQLCYLPRLMKPPAVLMGFISQTYLLRPCITRD
jgi:ATP-dependent RNA helicase DDX51/DBP6